MDLLEGLWDCWAFSSSCFSLLAHCSSWQRREGILALLALHIPEKLASSFFLATEEEAQVTEGLCLSQSGQVTQDKGWSSALCDRASVWLWVSETSQEFYSFFGHPNAPPVWESLIGVFPLIKLSRRRGLDSSLGKVESSLLSNPSQISLSTHQASTVCSECCCESLIFSHFNRRKLFPSPLQLACKNFGLCWNWNSPSVILCLPQNKESKRQQSFAAILPCFSVI